MLEDFLAPLYGTPWGRRMGLLAASLVSLLVLWTLITMPFNWRSDWKLVQSPKKEGGTSAQIATENVNYMTQIPHWHLFGNSHSNVSRLPVTSLQLNLVGVIEAVPNTFSRVIISEGGNPGKMYKINDTLSGVRINAITHDGVVLENAGRLEKLPLQRSPLSFQGMPKKSLPEE